MSKDLLTHVLVLLPLETISMFMLKTAVKKKLLEKIRKNSHAKGLLLKPGPRPWTRTLKNLDPEKPGINIGNVLDFRELFY